MSIITVPCPCGKSPRVSEDFAGRVIHCPFCNESVTVPLVEPERGSVQIVVARSDDPSTIAVRRRGLRVPFAAGFLLACLVFGSLAFVAYSRSPEKAALSKTSVDPVPPTGAVMPKARRESPPEVEPIVAEGNEDSGSAPSATPDSAPKAPPRVAVGPDEPHAPQPKNALAARLLEIFPPRIAVEPWMEHHLGPIRLLKGHDFPASFTFSPDGRFGISADGRRMVRWDLATGHRKWSKVLGEAGFPAVSPDSRLIASGNNFYLSIIDAENGEIASHIHAYSELMGSARSFRWFADANRLMVGSSSNLVSLWDVERRTKIVSIQVGRAVQTLDLSDDEGYYAAAMQNGVIQIGDISDMKWIKSSEYRGHRDSGFRPLAPSDRAFFARIGKGSYAASVGGAADAANSFQIWDLKDVSKSILRLNLEERLTGADLSRDWRLLVYTTESGRIRLYSLTEQKNIPFDDTGFKWKHRMPVISPDGNFLVTLGEDKSLRLWGLPRADGGSAVPGSVLDDATPTVADAAPKPNGGMPDELANVPRAGNSPGMKLGPADGDELAGIPRAKRGDSSKTAPGDGEDELAGVQRAGAAPSAKATTPPKKAALATPASPYAHIANAEARKLLEFAAKNAQRADSADAAERLLKHAAKMVGGDEAVMAEVRKIRELIAEKRRNAR